MHQKHHGGESIEGMAQRPPAKQHDHWLTLEETPGRAKGAEAVDDSPLVVDRRASLTLPTFQGTRGSLRHNTFSSVAVFVSYRNFALLFLPAPAAGEEGARL